MGLPPTATGRQEDQGPITASYVNSGGGRAGLSRLKPPLSRKSWASRGFQPDFEGPERPGSRSPAVLPSPCGPRTRRELAAAAPDPGADRRHAARQQRDARRGRQCVHDRQSGDWRDRAGGRPMLIRLAVGIILWCVAAVALLLVALIFLPLIAIFVEAWLATR